MDQNMMIDPGAERMPSDTPEAVKKRQDAWRGRNPDLVRFSLWVSKDFRQRIGEEVARQREERGEPDLPIQVLITEVLEGWLRDQQRRRVDAREAEVMAILSGDPTEGEAVDAMLGGG